VLAGCNHDSLTNHSNLSNLMAIRWADGSVVSVLAIGSEGPRFEPRFGLSQNTAPLSTRQYMDTWLKLGSKGGLAYISVVSLTVIQRTMAYTFLIITGRAKTLHIILAVLFTPPSFI